MKISELYPEVISENTQYEYKEKLNTEKPITWAKSLVGYANGQGGTVFIGVSNDGEAFGLTFDKVDKTRNLITLTNDNHIFPRLKLQYMIKKY